MIYPQIYVEKVEDITPKILQENNIKALILDVDNTLIDINKTLSDDVVKWVNMLKENKYKLFILSNTNHEEKVKTVADKLEIPYQIFAKKPMKAGFKKVQEVLKEKPENIAVVGDQIFTDVIGGNRSKMFSILVKPINEKDYWYTAWKRPIEKQIVNKYLKKKEKK